MKRILIAGYYGFGNLGDEAILSSALGDLQKEIPHAEFVALSGDPDATARQHGIPAVSWTDPDRILDAIHEADLVLLGGGGLFHDYWGAEPKRLGSFTGIGQDSYAGIPLLAHMVRKPCMLYGVGLGPLRDPAARDLAGAALEHCQIVTVRDDGSKLLAEELLRTRGAAAQQVILTADPAFGLRPAPEASGEATLESLGLEDGGTLLGISLRSWGQGPTREWEREIASALDQYLEEKSGQGLFLPFQAYDDLEVAQRVQVSMRRSSATRILDRPVGHDRMLSVIGRCALLLGMRYHSVLFSLLSGTRVAALAYDPKVSQLMEQASLGAWALPPSEWNSASVLSLLRNAADRQAPVGEPFRARMRARAQQSARLAASLPQMDLPEPSPSERIAHQVAVRYFGQVEENGALRQKNETLQDQAGRLLLARNQLARELSDLRDTLGVRLLDGYWRLARTIFPEGGTGRRVYRRASAELRSLLGRLGVDMHVTNHRTRNSQLDLAAFVGGAGSHERGGVRAPTGDIRLEMARFEQRVMQGGPQQVVAIFSSTQLIESEGQRPTHLALGLAKRGIPVVFVYWRWDKSPWTAQERLEDGILQVPIDVVIQEPGELFARFRGCDRTVLFEFPHPDFFESLAAAHAHGWAAVYDVIDDWEAFANVGWANWYDRETEEHFAWSADAVLCVNEILAKKIAGFGRTAADIVPNGCPENIHRIEAPVVLDRGELTVGYFGHLGGGWVDWSLVIGSAERRPDWLFYMIGYADRGRSRRVPKNVRLLGKKPQSSLAAYAANWDVGIVPFRAGPLSRASDPIKTYEYLAMGLPVVMAGCYPPIGGADLVLRAEGKDQFLDMIETAARDTGEAAASRSQFAQTATWANRVSSLLSLLARDTQRLGEKRRLFARAT